MKKSEEYLDRLNKEVVDLEVKLGKLEDFIENSLEFTNLSKLHQKLLRDQYEVMQAYLTILGKRTVFTSIDLLLPD